MTSQVRNVRVAPSSLLILPSGAISPAASQSAIYGDVHWLIDGHWPTDRSRNDDPTATDHVSNYAEPGRQSNCGFRGFSLTMLALTYRISIYCFKLYCIFYTNNTLWYDFWAKVFPQFTVAHDKCHAFSLFHVWRDSLHSGNFIYLYIFHLVTVLLSPPAWKDKAYSLAHFPSILICAPFGPQAGRDEVINTRTFWGCLKARIHFHQV